MSDVFGVAGGDKVVMCWRTWCCRLSSLTVKAAWIVHFVAWHDLAWLRAPCSVLAGAP